MKKAIALLLALLTPLAGLPALAEASYGAWTIEFNDIELTVMDETLAARPSIVLRVGFTEDLSDAWLTADLMNDGESMAGFMVQETENGRSRFAYTAGETCGVMDGKNGARFHAVAMLQMGMDERDVPDDLSGALAMLDALLRRPKGVEYLFSQLGSARKLNKSQYAVSVELPDARASATLNWRWDRRAKKPFDLSGRREAPYSIPGGIAGTEGMEEARAELEEALAQDESMEELMIALMLLFDE